MNFYLIKLIETEAESEEETETESEESGKENEEEKEKRKDIKWRNEKTKGRRDSARARVGTKSNVS